MAFISVLSDPDGKRRVLSSQIDLFITYTSQCFSNVPVQHYKTNSFHFLLAVPPVSLCIHIPLFQELSQDVASKGLGLVYEMGGEGDQQELVSTLVETLMTGKR